MGSVKRAQKQRMRDGYILVVGVVAAIDLRCPVLLVLASDQGGPR